MTGPAFRLATAALLAGAATRAHAQPATADTLPFHPAEWGVEAGLGGGGGTVGALRFLTRATALTLNVNGSYSSMTNEPSAAAGSQGFRTSTGSAALNVGVRRYAPITTVLGSFLGVAAGASYSAQHFVPDDARSHQYGVGVSAEAGVSYFVLPHLALNGAYGLGVQRSTGTDRQTAHLPSGVTQTIEQHTRSWSVQTSGVRVTASIFF